MSTAEHQVSGATLAAAVMRMRGKGIRLWTQDGELRFRAPKGALTTDDIDGLRRSKGQILALLHARPSLQSVEHQTSGQLSQASAPLSYSQLAHWKRFGLGRRSAIRQIASATRIRGPLDFAALRVAIAAVVERHAALRTRVVPYDGTPVQEIATDVAYQVQSDDLSMLPEAERHAAVIESIQEFIVEPIDASVGMLFGVRLLQLSSAEHVLILAMEHMISDAYSRGLLLRELLQIYTHELHGTPLSLPQLRSSIAEYALQQRDQQPAWLERHEPYWREQILPRERLRFPRDPDAQRAALPGWSSVPFKIDAQLKRRLSDWCREMKTTLALALFAVFAAAMLRRCAASSGVIRYQSDGRDGVEQQNTVGYFASELFLRVELQFDATFIGLLDQATRAYCEAHEHRDHSYFAAQFPEHDFAKNPAFNWIPETARIEPPGAVSPEHALSCSPVPFPHPMVTGLQLDEEPVMVLYEAAGGIAGDLYFALSEVSRQSMAHFVASYLALMQAMLRDPEVAVATAGG
jgi:hypothetical protein